MEWYESHENLANLARYIIDKEGEIDTVLFIEKPYKWENEWNEYQNEQKMNQDLDAFDRRDK